MQITCQKVNMSSNCEKFGLTISILSFAVCCSGWWRPAPLPRSSGAGSFWTRCQRFGCRQFFGWIKVVQWPIRKHFQSIQQRVIEHIWGMALAYAYRPRVVYKLVYQDKKKAMTAWMHTKLFIPTAEARGSIDILSHCIFGWCLHIEHWEIDKRYMQVLLGQTSICHLGMCCMTFRLGSWLCFCVHNLLNGPDILLVLWEVL